MNKALKQVLSIDKVQDLQNNGVLVFDVDDTLLARKKSPLENDQIYNESAAAQRIPELLDLGFKICVITGHGWKQLKKRLVVPLLEDIKERFEKNACELQENFSIYANRGATKLIWKNNSYISDEKYGGKYSLLKADLLKIDQILSDLKTIFEDAYEKRKDWYLETFELFPISELPIRIIERENVILGLRPIPSNYHSTTTVKDSPRNVLFELGRQKLAKFGLDRKYQIDKSGKSTLEVTRQGISKEIAFRDLIEKIAKAKEITMATVESSSVYIGDEFAENGNDAVISKNFQNCLCFSVGSDDENRRFSDNVISVQNVAKINGVEATAMLLEHISKIIRF